MLSLSALFVCALAHRDCVRMSPTVPGHSTATVCESEFADVSEALRLRQSQALRLPSYPYFLVYVKAIFIYTSSNFYMDKV